MPKIRGLSKERKVCLPKRNRAVKRSMSSHSDDTTDSADSNPFFSNENAGTISYEVDIKEEPLEYDSMEGDSSATDDATGLEEVLIETVKTEKEDDPLTEDLSKGCDEGFSPGSAENLPQIDVFAATEYLVSLPDYDKQKIRALWKQSRDLIDDSIGYVQVRRQRTICTIKCVVASKTTKNHCTVTYDEADGDVRAISCDCQRLQCGHGVTALIWLCGEKSGIYWLQPMVTRNPKTMTISAIFGFPETSRVENNGVFREFMKYCQENNILNPLLRKRYEEDEKASFDGDESSNASFEKDDNFAMSIENDENLKASLKYLMEKFKKYFRLDVDLFLNFCRENININKLEVFSPEHKQELKYGRITDILLYDVTESKADEVGDLVKMITLPNIKENVEASCHLIECLEKSLNMKIRKCGLLLSDTYPILAATPYGITDTQVVYIKYLEEDEFYAQKMEPKYKACMQLQMYLAKKESACFCVVHKTKKIDIMFVNFNSKKMLQLIDRATAFWQAHIFQCIAMKTEIELQ